MATGLVTRYRQVDCEKETYDCVLNELRATLKSYVRVLGCVLCLSLLDVQLQSLIRRYEFESKKNQETLGT